VQCEQIRSYCNYKQNSKKCRDLFTTNSDRRLFNQQHAVNAG